MNWLNMEQPLVRLLKTITKELDYNDCLEDIYILRESVRGTDRCFGINKKK